VSNVIKKRFLVKVKAFTSSFHAYTTSGGQIESIQVENNASTVRPANYKESCSYSHYPVLDCPKLRGTSRAFDKAIVFARFVNVATAVILLIVEFAMFVRSCLDPVLFRINPSGYEVVFNRVPF
jgi:hypothetical protein